MTVTLKTEFSEKGQSEPWKNEVARELNLLLWHAQWGTTLNPASRKRIESTTLSIVQRVADFEEIFVLKGEEQ